jgi:hypothetical protein
MSSEKEHGAGLESVPYCLHCTDEQGKLKSFEEIRTHFGAWIKKTAQDKNGAEFLASWLMSYQPAWRNRSAAE